MSGAKGDFAPGERFGELVIVRFSHKDEAARYVWLLECDCGRTTLRTTSALREGLRRNGRGLACATCWAELQAGRAIDRRDSRASYLRDMWDEHRDLYHPHTTLRMEREIRDAIEAEEGPFHDPDVAAPFIVEPGEPADSSLPMTWAEIAAEFDLSVERVRQIGERALRKLRHPSRLRLLGLLDIVRPDAWVEQQDAVERALKAAGLPTSPLREELLHGLWT